MTHDVLIVGGGPGGMQAAIAAASEGLGVLVLERDKVGGQIGQTPKLENSVFARRGGVTGPELAQQMREQAQAMGVQIAKGEASRLSHGRPHNLVEVTGEAAIPAHAVVLAMGNAWQHLDIPGIKPLIGKRVHYGPVHSLRPVGRGEHVAVYGGGPSAGQAILALADQGAIVHVLMRSTLKMPQYLVDRIEAHEKVGRCVLERNVKIARLADERGHLRITLTPRLGSELRVQLLLMCNGLVPATKWLKGTLDLDPDGRIITQLPSLQTRIPNVYAIGDCRSGSSPRVGIAVGDGSMVVTEIWRQFKQSLACTRCKELLAV